MNVINLIRKLSDCLAISRPKKRGDFRSNDRLCENERFSVSSRSVNKDVMVLASPMELDSLEWSWKAIVELSEANREMELQKKLYPSFKQAACTIKCDFVTLALDLHDVEDRFRSLDGEYYDFHFSRFILGACREVLVQTKELHASRAVEFSHLEYFVHASKTLELSLADRKKYLNYEIGKNARTLTGLNASIEKGIVSVDTNKDSNFIMPVVVPQTVRDKTSVEVSENSDERLLITKVQYRHLKYDRRGALKREVERNNRLRRVNWKGKIENAKRLITMTEGHIEEALAFHDALLKVESVVFSYANLRKALPDAIDLIEQPGERASTAAAIELENIQSMKARQVAQFHILRSEWELLKEPSRRLEELEQVVAVKKAELMRLTRTM